MDIKIEKAEANDIPVLAEINRLAYTPETVTMIAFRNWPDEENMFNFFQERIQERFRNTQTIVFKAVSSATNAILGFVCWTLVDGEDQQVHEREPTRTPLAAATLKFPNALNMEFVKANGAEVERLHRSLTSSTHFYVSAFAVPPRNQRHGIGSKLLRHCLANADQMKLPTCLISFPGCHDLYVRYGFEDIEHLDTDLNYWDNSRYRGFGIWRNYAMRRMPR